LTIFCLIKSILRKQVTFLLQTKNMKFSVTSIFLMMLSGFNAVYAQENVILRILLNTRAGSCQGSDWDFVEHQIYTMSINQRQLRGDVGSDEGNAADSIISEVDNKARELQTYPRECANSCRTYPAGRCMALNCRGYRRGLMESTRELFWSTPCENQKSEVRNLLTNIANNNQVGASCKASLLQAPQMDCYSNVDC
jgi:hypothetical protein